MAFASSAVTPPYKSPPIPCSLAMMDVKIMSSSVLIKISYILSLFLTYFTLFGAMKPSGESISNANIIHTTTISDPKIIKYNITTNLNLPYLPEQQELLLW